jgi:CHASE2 domain-containing sensor protein
VFSHADAPAILCNSPAKDEIVKRYNVNCALYPPPERADLLGRIIVIGDDVEGVDRNDLFPDQPQVPGMYLQANYIESLLDGRYLRPFGAGWNFTILAAWVVFLYLIFWIQPEVALAASLAVAYLVKLLVIQLVLWKGLYPQIWVGELGVVAILLKYIDSRGHRVVHAIEEWREDRHRQHRKRKPKAKN